MKKITKYFFLLIICALVNISNSYAAETCSYKDKANLNKLASQVTASYEIKKENNQVYFEISLSNIVNDLYLVVEPSSKTLENSGELNSFEVYNSMTTNGTYTFKVNNTTDVITYNIRIRSTIEGCIYDIFTIKQIKPRRNKFYDMTECKYEEVVNYTYCQEWVDTEFALVDSEILKKIENQRSAKKKTITTKCLQCEVDSRNEAKRSRYKMIKNYIIIGLIIGIIVDIITIAILIIRVRRFSI